MLRVPAVPRNGNPIDLGFDQLGWVRVVRHGAETRYEVVGTVRRRPRTCAVSVATATALVGMGLPTVASHCAHCRDFMNCGA